MIKDRTSVLSIGIIICLFGGAVFAVDSPSTQPSSTWKLSWSDEFNGAQIDPTHWTFDEGNGFTAPGTQDYIWGWGNDELEFYTSRPDNAYVKDGLLHIRAVAESYRGNKYTSARMTTKGLFSQTYGRFEFRAKLPVGKGLWPALWLLPADNAYGTWAASGEIDITEARGHEASKVLGTLHYGSSWPGNAFTEADYDLPDGGTINDFHVYALEWEPGVMRWYVDRKLYSTKRNWWSCSKKDAKKQGLSNPPAADRNPWPAPFNKPFYIIMNLAVGGRFPGNPDSTTSFPQEMLVDYVRVYDKADYGNTPPPGAADESPDGQNLALNKPATASSQENDEHAPAMADDGNGGTRWCAINGDVPQWWQVDLQKPANLSGVEIKWESDGKNYQYVIEGSSDGQTWKTLSDQSATTDTSQVQHVKFTAAAIRFVRIRVTGLTEGSWASINEVKVFAVGASQVGTP